MAYSECETALATLLKTLNGAGQFVSSAYVTQADYSILDRGVPVAAVLEPDTFSSIASKGATYDRVWDILIDLFIKFTKESVTIPAFITLRDAVIRKIDQNPNLSGTAGVYDMVVSSDGGIVDVNMETDAPGAKPVFKSQRLRVSVYQTLTV